MGGGRGGVAREGQARLEADSATAAGSGRFSPRTAPSAPLSTWPRRVGPRYAKAE